jgi:hypothetical protein
MALASALSLPSASSADEAAPAQNGGGGDSFIKKGVSAVVSTGVSTTKEIASGVSEGIEAGRKSGQSVDGALLVSNKDDFMEIVGQGRALKVADFGGGAFEVTVAIKNDHDRPLRLTNLANPGNAVLLDSEGFAYTTNDTADVTILPKTASRVRFNFDKVELPPAVLRLYDFDIPLVDARSEGAGG